MKVKAEFCPKCQGPMVMSKTERVERAGVVRILNAFGAALPGVEAKLIEAEPVCYKCFKKLLLPELQGHLSGLMGKQIQEIEEEK